MTGYVTPTTWEQCARHVEAGGIVEVQTAWGAWEREYLTPRTYRRRHGAPGGSAWVTRRLVPIESAARTGAERYLTDRMTDPEYAEAHLEATRHLTATVVPDGYEAVWLPSETVDEFDAGEDDRVSRGHVVAGAREAQARRGTTPAPPPAPSPVPPWPGAVLSGLVDEDGVPTWLAQAGQVRGEQVRSWHGSGWVAATHSRYAWVEVRAPRAVPEPETERVPWYRAMGRTLPYGELLGDIVQAYPSADSPGGIYVEYELPERNTTGNPHRDDADGTVEVLRRDGDQ